MSYAEKHPVRLDEMMKSVAVPVSHPTGTSTALVVAGSETGRKASITSESVWAHVGMQGGVRVLTLSIEKVEPPSIAGEDEPHSYLGLSFSAVGLSIVHTGVEELLTLVGSS